MNKTTRFWQLWESEVLYEFVVDEFIQGEYEWFIIMNHSLTTGEWFAD